MKKTSVYIVVNRTDGKVYVGKSVAPEERWRCHRAYASTGRGFRLHSAIREDGIENFGLFVVKEFESDDAASKAEVGLIALLGSTDPARGYNITSGGEDRAEAISIANAANRARSEADPEAERARNSVRGKLAAKTLGKDRLREKLAAARSHISAEDQRQLGLRMVAALSKEERRAKARKANDTLGPEGRRLRALAATQTLGTEGLSARAKKVVAAQTPEQRSEARRKAWATRRQRLAESACST